MSGGRDEEGEKGERRIGREERGGEEGRRGGERGKMRLGGERGECEKKGEDVREKARRMDWF